MLLLHSIAQYKADTKAAKVGPQWGMCKGFRLDRAVKWWALTLPSRVEMLQIF